MKNSAEIREEMGRQYDKAQAIIDVARAAKRELTDEENATIDGINGSGNPKEAVYKPGVIDKLKADLQRAENIEAREAELTATRHAANVNAKRAGAQNTSHEDDEDEDALHAAKLAKIRIPATARYQHGGLKAFKGATAEKEAYVTGQFLLATIGNSDASRQWCKDHGVDIRYRGALKESDNSLGGFVVPQEMEKSIINLREVRGVLRKEARVYPMGSDTLTIPRRTGGITSYFVAELGAATASNPTLDQVSLSAKKLMALCAMSSEVSEDAIISMADWVTAEIAYSFADKEDACGFNGDGSNTYGGMTGIKNALAAGSVFTATSHAEFSTLTLADFHGMTAKLPLYAQQNAKWFISKAGFSASMERLMAAGGGNTWQTLANGNSVPKFLGYDVVFVQVMNSALTGNTGVTGGVYFGDVMQGVALGSRRGLSLDTSKDFYFDTDQIAIRGIERFDVNVHEIGTASAAGSIISLTFG